MPASLPPPPRSHQPESCPCCQGAGVLVNPFSTLAEDWLDCPSCGLRESRWATTEPSPFALEENPMTDDRDDDDDRDDRDPVPVFRTSDGYTLWLDGETWTDGDLAFEDRDGRPVDATGAALEGEIVDGGGCDCG